MPNTSNSAASELLITTLTDIVAEMVEAKCQRLTARERGTLQRRIGKTVDVFVKGLQLSPQQRRAEEKRRKLAGE
jgi:hypothetical protein